ncbi:MAG: cysteine--tRNA ligase, partial [Candidatus Woesearchaeota archaeon]|nr:cysteine--tRNA ligase [Candidatus Woesearchaeota archaeon]
FEDLLRRYLKFKGFAVKQVMNLTDVDDKIIRDSQKQGLSLREFTDKYAQAFFEDIKTLNIEPAEVYPRATEHISEMVCLINVLLEKGFAYKASDGIYFSIKKFKQYGKLAHIDTAQLKVVASGRVKADEYNKEDVADFALWKFWDEQDGNVFWETEIGKGRPGWHIECSAMSAKHLTAVFDNTGFDNEKFTTLDIHTGGVDNIFPHHENEIAQSEACFGIRFVRVWMHSEHLLVDNKKMAKSAGTFYTVRDLLAKGFSAVAIRYLLLSTHYRAKLNFTLESLSAAKSGVDRLQECVRAVLEAKDNPALVAQPSSPSFARVVDSLLKKFERTLDNDLDISKALAVVFAFVSKTNALLAKEKISASDAETAIQAFKKLNSVLGILSFDQDSLPTELVLLLNSREKARNKKDWKESDRIRQELLSKGVLVEDTPTGSRWKVIQK